MILVRQRVNSQLHERLVCTQMFEDAYGLPEYVVGTDSATLVVACQTPKPYRMSQLIVFKQLVCLWPDVESRSIIDVES